MPSQQEVQWSQLKVGVLVIVALAALTALVFLMSGSTGGIFTSKLTLRSYFENAAGLKEGAPVNLEGVTIGTVTTVKHRARAQAHSGRSNDEDRKPNSQRPCIRIPPRAWRLLVFWAIPW